ncbi:MAG: PEGA domain-containing protein [Ignavibacteriaceae bacterium]
MKDLFNNTNYRQIIITIFLIVITALLSSCQQEVSVTPPDTPPPDGFVFIDSKPGGANIYLNGKDRRKITPDSLTWLGTGDYTITLKKELYRDTTINIKVVEGSRRKVLVDYTLNPGMLGKILCNAKPDGAQIFINDSATGRVTPATLENITPGFYSILYRAQNHRDDSISVAISSGSLSSAKITLVDTTVWRDFNTKTSGIPTNYLTDISVDNNNNLWIGTEDKGLLKYNGSEWKTYFPGNSLLKDSKINTVDVNDDGTVWVGDKFGISGFNANSGFQFRFNSLDFGAPLTDYFVVDAVMQSHGHEIIVTQKTAVTFESSSSGIPTSIDTRTAGNFGGITSDLTAGCVDKFGNNFIGSSSMGVYIGGQYIKLFNTSNSSIIGNKVSAIASDPITGGTWIGFISGVAAGSGISYFYNGTFQSYYVIPEKTNTNSIYVDDSGKKWIGTNSGLVTFTNGANDITLFTKANSGLEINDVRGVVKDKLGRVWIATYGGGLFLKMK